MTNFTDREPGYIVWCFTTPARGQRQYACYCLLCVPSLLATPPRSRHITYVYLIVGVLRGTAPFPALEAALRLVYAFSESGLNNQNKLVRKLALESA
jgi:hypothetical protein